MCPRMREHRHQRFFKSILFICVRLFQLWWFRSRIYRHVFEIEYDKTKSAKLVETLRVFLSCKNIAKTARRLNRHRQTLLYQLEKIEDLTGISLKNNDEVFLLEVCMRLQVPFYPAEDEDIPSHNIE